MKYLLAIWLFLFNAFIANADPLTEYVSTMTEQEIAIAWVATAATTELPKDKPAEIVSHAYAHATTLGISPVLLLAVMRVETGFQSQLVSKHDGARGIMQVIPRYHKDKIAGRDLLTTSVGIEVGSTILNNCMERNNHNTYKALSCYSGGGGKKYYQKVQNVVGDIMRHFRDSAGSPASKTS